MFHLISRWPTGVLLVALAACLVAPLARPTASAGDGRRGVVHCANLVYGDGKTSVYFSSEFLAEIARVTHVVTEPAFESVNLEAPLLYRHPFAVMTGEDSFTLTDAQRNNLREYLEHGGFVLASAGCSSPGWAESFRQEIARVFPDVPLEKLDMSHPAFHTVYEISALDCKRSDRKAHLEGLQLDGRIVLVFSEDGLNDTANAGGNCCCCGGNEILNARQVNVNLLAYTLTH
jgi:hypothetical protein